MRGVWSVFGSACVFCAACGGTTSALPPTDGGASNSGSGGDSGSGAAQGSSTSSGSMASGAGSGSSASGGGSGSLINGDGGSSSGGSACSGAAADFVYVLSAENDLYSFAPNAKAFTKIGALGCKTSMQPNSMAVDRNATAYVNYVQSSPLGDTAGAIFQVSTQDASCTGPLLSLPSGWYRVGMGYSSDSASATTEVLYVDGVGNGIAGGGIGLGHVDFAQGIVDPIGPFTGALAGQNAELTGTADGTLFGFFTTTPVYVAQIDKVNGSTMTPVPMTGVQKPSDWAFSFWGGHFYLYTSQGAGFGGGSNVTDYDPVSGSINTSFMTAIGFDIVGAGVSTCAPTSGAQ